MGIAWGLAAAGCQASYFLIADRAGARTPPLVLTGAGMVVGTVAVAGLGLAGVLPVAVAVPPAGPVLLAGTDVGWPVAAGLLIAVSTVLAYGLGVVAIGRIGASGGALVALIMAGVALAQLRATPRAAPAPA